jgi:hypothetical protein
VVTKQPDLDERLRNLAAHPSHASLSDLYAGLREAIGIIDQQRVEIDRLHLSEESWNKEAERHERDHRAHYQTREELRAANQVLREIAIHLHSMCERGTGTRNKVLDGLLGRAIAEGKDL